MRESLIIVGLAILPFAAVDNSIAQVGAAIALSDKASIDCTKAGSTVAKILCGSHEGATADWDLNSTLWALAGTLPETQQRAFDQNQDRWRAWLNGKCMLKPPSANDLPPDQQQCVTTEFHNRAAMLRSKLTGEVLTESKLSPEQHAQVQASLIARGLLQPPADGEFGGSTRQAIRKFQESIGATQTGFLSHEQISQLRVAQSPHAPLPASAEGPSFNCAKATYPDERAICTEPELTQLDNIANAGYQFLRRVYAPERANQLRIASLEVTPSLRGRHGVHQGQTACDD